MGRAIAAQTVVSYITEATDGTTPATPAFKTVRSTGESVDIMRKIVYSSELNANRGPKYHALAGKGGGGGYNFEYSHGLLDDMLESALRGAWATNVLTNAYTAKSFTVESRYETGTTDIFKRLKGAQVNSLTLSCKPQERVTGSIEFMSRYGDFANAIVTGATYVAASTEPMAMGDSVGTISMSGLTLDTVAEISLTLNNNLKAREVLGQLEALELIPGDLEITGSVKLFVSDTEFDVLTAYQDATATSLSFRVGSTVGKILQVSLPNIILEKPDIKAEARDGELPLNLNFRALQATSLSGSQIQITRNL